MKEPEKPAEGEAAEGEEGAEGAERGCGLVRVPCALTGLESGVGKEALTPAIEETKAKQHKITVPKGSACRAALGASR